MNTNHEHTDREWELLELIRTGEDPAALLAVALEAIIEMLQLPVPSE